jgi:Zn-dependent protease/CBS domain-containing protein
VSLQITKIKGISIKLHFSLILVFFLISWTLSTGFMPEYVPNLTQIQYGIMGIIGTLILFISVLVHELSHSIVAIKSRIKVRQIVLFIFGGVSDIEEEPKNFRIEFNMAIAGPAMSFTLSVFFAFLWWINSFLVSSVTNTSFFTISVMIKGILFYASVLNLILGIFNLVPAFPMDGGRILRAILFQKNKNYDKSTKLSVNVGIIISYMFFGFGLLTILSGHLISGIWIILIGWFIQNGAQAYLYQYDIMKTLSNIKVEEIMSTTVISVSEDMTIEYILKNYFSTFMKSAFPVINSNGNELIGIIILKECLNIPEENKSITTVKKVMLPKDRTIIMNGEDTADKALNQMVTRNQDKAYICDSNNIPIGVVSKTDLLEAINKRKLFLKQTK